MRTNSNDKETELLRDLIDTASICIISTDKEGIVTSINRAGEKLYGYRSEEILGKNINILFSDRNPKTLIDNLEDKRLNGESWEAEVWRTRKDGSVILTEKSTGCAYQGGWFQIGIGNFPTNWSEGEILKIEISSTFKDEIYILEQKLTASDPQITEKIELK